MEEAIKDLRQRMGVSQQAFSNRLGLSLRAIANYESGRQPTAGVLFRLAKLASASGYADLSEFFSSAYAKRLKGSLRPTSGDEVVWVRMILCLVRNKELIPGWHEFELAALESLEKLTAASYDAKNLKTDPEEIKDALLLARHQLKPSDETRLLRMIKERLSQDEKADANNVCRSVMAEHPDLCLRLITERGMTMGDDLLRALINSLTEYKPPAEPASATAEPAAGAKGK